jgi:hypothetical protein
MSLLDSLSAFFARLRGTNRRLAEIRARQLRYLDGLKPPSEEAVDTCEHRLLRPTWDHLGDIGNEARTSAYVCEQCRQTFSLEEAASYLSAA